MNPTHDGGCLCGGVRYRLHEAPIEMNDCHCIDCRRASGAPFVTWGSVRKEKLELLSGSLRRVGHADRLRTFAACCGTPLFFQKDAHAEWLDVTIASLDRPERFAPDVAIWTEDRLPWIPLDPSRPAYARSTREGVVDPAGRKETAGVRQIDHVALTCRSVEETARWFERVLGFEHVFPGAWGGVPVFLRLGSTSVALFPLRDPGGGEPASAPRPRLEHLAFRAETRRDFERARRHLGENGVSGTFQDHEVSHSVYFRDPDGHLLEITTYDVAGASGTGDDPPGPAP